ncbi:VanZ family protein [bacterium]
MDKHTKIYKFLLIWMPFLLWCFFIFYLSNIPNLSTGLSNWDLILRKLAHITEFGILYILTLRVIIHQKLFYQLKISKKNLAILFCILYAISDEFHQGFVSMRIASCVDVLIDAAGIFIAVIICNQFKKYIPDICEM